MANDQLIAMFGEKLNDDEHLFRVLDLRLPAEDQRAVLMIGSQAEGMLRNGHYHVEYHTPNSTSKKALVAAQREKLKADHPAMEGFHSPLVQIDELKEKVALLEAENAMLKLPKGRRAPKLGEGTEDQEPEQKEDVA